MSFCRYPMPKSRTESKPQNNPSQKVPQTMENLQTMREAYVHNVTQMLNVGQIGRYEQALLDGTEIICVQTIRAQLADRLKDIDVDDIDEVVLEALEEAVQAIDEPFGENDRQWEDVSDDEEDNSGSYEETNDSFVKSDDEAESKDSRPTNGTKPNESAPPNNVLCVWDARRVVKVLEPELFAKAQADIPSVTGNLERFNEAGRRLRNLLGPEKMDYYKGVAKLWNKEGPGSCLMHDPYVCRKYKRSRRSYLHSSWRQFRVHQVVLSFYVGANAEPHYSFMEGPSEITMEKSAPKAMKQIQQVFAKWIRDYVQDDEAQSSKPGPEWIYPCYPDGDETAYPLLCKRDPNAGHEHLKSGLRLYCNAVAKYYGRKVMPWRHLRDKDLEMFTRDTFVNGMTIGDPSTLGKDVNKLWWDTMYERQQENGDKPVKFRAYVTATSNPTEVVSHVDSSSSEEERHLEPVVSKTVDKAKAPMRVNSAANGGHQCEQTSSRYVDVSDTPGPDSPLANFDASDEEDFGPARTQSHVQAHREVSVVPTAAPVLDENSGAAVLPVKKRKRRNGSSKTKKKARAVSPVPTSTLPSHVDDTGTTGGPRRSNRPLAPSRRRDDDSVKSGTSSALVFSPGIHNWSIESLQPLLLECGWAQYIYNGMPDRPDWKRGMVKWLKAEQRLPYTAGAEMPSLLRSSPSFMKAWVDFKNAEGNRYREYFVPDEVLASASSIREAEGWIGTLNLKTLASRVDEGGLCKAPWLKRGGGGLAQVFFTFSVWGRALRRQSKSSVQSLINFRSEFARFDTICDAWYSTL